MTDRRVNITPFRQTYGEKTDVFRIFAVEHTINAMAEYNLERFIKAQDAAYSGYTTALAEVKAGRKRSHWIWYVFPQIKGLGHSYNSEYYGISCLAEAKAYLADSTLGPRLHEITQALLAIDGKPATEILGGIDAMKVKSSMTLFDAADPGGIFATALEKNYDGKRDALTLSRLGK